MSVARSERRAALREALKLAQKAAKANAAVNPTAAIDPSALAAAAVATAFTSTTSAAAAAGAATAFAPAPEPQEEQQPTASDAQIAANRANAQKSCGPVTPEGRAKSSLNAIKTGLTGRTVLLPSDDAEQYQKHLDRYFASLAPATDDEHDLVQAIADAQWRNARIAPLETAIFTLGRRKFAHLFPEETDPVKRNALLDAEIFLTYRRDLNNLAIQEGRLARQLEKNMAKLDALREQRKKKERDTVLKAGKMRQDLAKEGKEFDPPEFGFEFTKEEFDFYCDRSVKQLLAQRTLPSLSEVIAEYRKARKAA